MIRNWTKLAFDAARLQAEAQSVIALRMMRLAKGGKIANREARRMVTEKGVALAEAASTLAAGGSMSKVVAKVRSRVAKNRRRLSRSR
jgi:hypothetical protein